LNRRTIIFLTLLIFSPYAVCANVGSPILWATGFQLYIGNAIIGVLEGWLLAKVFRLPRIKCMGVLVLANYFSAWIGMFIVGMLRYIYTPDIYNAVRLTLILVFITYVCTLVLEWPFVAFCFRGKSHWFRRSVLASLLVQTLSYLILFSGFWFISFKSLYADFSIVPPDRILLPADVSVYFISNTDGNVYRRSGTNEHELIAHLASTNDLNFLRIQESEDTSNSWDLVAVIPDRYHYDNSVPIIKDIITGTDQSFYQTHFYNTWGEAPRIGSATKSTWHFNWEYWCLQGEDEKSDEFIFVAFDNPMLNLSIRVANQLPEHKVLFQLGKDQLCLLDVDKREIAVWDRGYGPVAIAEKEKNK